MSRRRKDRQRSVRRGGQEVARQATDREKQLGGVPSIWVRQLEEARRPAPVRGAGAGQQARSFSVAWAEHEALGLPPDQRRSGPGQDLTEAEKKETLWRAYLTIPWIAACVHVIARRLVSGGYVIEPVKEGEGDERNRQILEQFILRTDEDWDFLQFIESVAVDLLIFGEAYAEIVRDARGLPYVLHKIDCLSMNYRLAESGEILGYEQRLSRGTQKVIPFQPDEVIRWWRPSPRAAMQALSPIELLTNAIYAEQQMQNWSHRFFRNGARPPYWISTPGDEEEAARLIAFHREHYTGAKNAHVPLVLHSGAQLHEFSRPSVDVDFLKGRQENRDEILAIFGVPPAMVGLIESGNIGGGTGESQHKSFQYNAVDPLLRLIFEKFNFRVVLQGFGISDWRIATRYADYRDDKEVAEVQDKRIRVGLSTLNEERAAMGRRPYEKGGDTAVVVASRDIVPVERLDELADEQRQQQRKNQQQEEPFSLAEPALPEPLGVEPPEPEAEPEEQDDDASDASDANRRRKRSDR